MIQRPYCGYFWAALLSLWVLAGYSAIVLIRVRAGWDWLDWATLPFDIGIHAYMIRLIWQRQLP